MNTNATNNPEAAASGPTQHNLPARNLNQPYFDLRAPDKINTYFLPENLRVVKFEQELLARFLADAALEHDNTGRNRQIHYSLGPIPQVQLRPLKYLPLSEIEAFEKAARTFYDRAHHDSPVPFAEKELRRHFKLPDPDEEPDAYWIYGEPFDPRLLILWGCEKKRETSLPLIEDEEIAPKNKVTVAQKLRQRLLPWEQMQKETLTLLEATNEPLSRFIGAPVFDEKGQLVKIRQKGTAVSIGRFHKLKTLPAHEVNAFESAAREFYRKAHPDCAESKPYEKELRRNFRLPDPDRFPDAYWVYNTKLGTRLMILCQGTEEKEDCLCLTRDADLNLPEGESAPSAPASAALEAIKGKPEQDLHHLHSVSEKLKLRQKAAWIEAVKWAAVIALIALLVVMPRLADKELTLAKAEVSDDAAVDPRNEKNVVVLAFSKKIEPKSLASVAAAQGPKLAEQFIIKNATTTLAITNATLSPNQTTLILRTAEPFTEGLAHSLSVQQIKPLKGKGLRPNTQVSLLYEDNRPPALQNPSVSADPDSTNKVWVMFSEKVQKASAESKENFTIDGFNVTGTTLHANGNTVILETSGPGFEKDKRYKLTVQQVADDSRKNNRMAKTVTDFPYIDLMPLRIQEILANESQLKVALVFNKRIDASSAAPQGNYVCENPPLSIKFSKMRDPKTVELTTSPMKPLVDYQLRVRGVKDFSNIQADETKSFRYAGPVDTTGPVITDVSLSEKRLTLSYNKELGGGADKAAAYKFLVRQQGGGWTPCDLNITPVRDADVRIIHLDLASPLPPGHFKLEYSGVEDLLGNVSSSFKEFNNSGRIYPPKVTNVRLSQDKSQVLLRFNRQLDPVCVKKENFKLTGGTNGLEIVELTFNPSGATTEVALKLSSKLTEEAIDGRWSNLKVAGEVQVYPGDSFGVR